MAVGVPVDSKDTQVSKDDRVTGIACFILFYFIYLSLVCLFFGFLLVYLFFSKIDTFLFTSKIKAQLVLFFFLLKCGNNI